MKITAVELSGFLAYKNKVELELPDGLIAFHGVTGAGKSSLMQGVLWTISNSLRVNNDTDSVINGSSDQAIGRVEFVHQGVDYAVERVRNRGKGKKAGTMSLTLEEWGTNDSWKNISAHSTKDTQAKIFDIIGMNTDMLYSLMFLDQGGRGNRFTAAKPEDRRSILISMIPELNQWSEFNKSIAEKLKNNKTKLSVLEGSTGTHLEYTEQAKLKVEQLQKEQAAYPSSEEAHKKLNEYHDVLRVQLSLSESLISKLERELLTLKTERVEKNAEIAQKRTAAKDRYNKAITLDDDRLDILSDIDNLKTEDYFNTEINNLSDKTLKLTKSSLKLEESLKDKENQIDENLREIAKLQALTENLSEKCNVVEKMIHQHDEDNSLLQCDFCHSEINHEVVSSILNDYLSQIEQKTIEMDKFADLKETLTSEINPLKAEISQEQRELRSLEEKVWKLEESAKTEKAQEKKLNDLLVSIREKIANFLNLDISSDLEESLEKEIDSSMESFQSLVDLPQSSEEIELQKKIDDVENQSNNDDELNKLRANITNQENILEDITTISGELAAAARQWKNSRDRNKESAAELKSLREENTRLEALREASGPKGIPSVIIADLLEDIAVNQNELLSELAGGRDFTVSYSMEKESRTGTVRPSLDIMIHMDDGTRTIESLSGGEHAKATLTNMIAMINVINRRSPGTVEDIWFDEAFVAMDKTKTPVVISMLNELLRTTQKEQTPLKTIIVVSHDDRLLNGIPESVEFTVSPGGETIVTTSY